MPDTPRGNGWFLPLRSPPVEKGFSVKHRNSARWAVLAAAALGIASLTASPSGAADPSPRPGKFNPAARPSVNPSDVLSARHAYFVQFKGAGAADVAQKAGGGSRGVTAAKARRAEVGRVASSVLAAARKVDGKASSIYTVSNAIPGAGMYLDGAGFAVVASNPNVAKVSRLVAKTAEMTSVNALVKSLNVWRNTGNTGKGVTIGIVDTGVDFTHADFGGVGTVAAYDAAATQETDPSWWQKLPKKAKAKFAGGYDFAGDAYDGDGTGGAEVPRPDNNPLDCNGHGTHVAGISAGYGVSASGKTLKAKKYKKLTKKKLSKLDVGPGIAPKSKIFALRVFGCDGSTYLDIPAYDRALDPDGDGDFSDHLDIINASLGADYAPQDDPGTDVINKIAEHGVLPALSIGNNGDLTDTGGAPGNATASIASASSVDKLDLFDGLRVNAPPSVAGVKPGQFSVAYDWIHEAPVTGQVATLTEADNLDGCDPLNPTDAARVNGKVAWLEWDDNDVTRRCGSVARSANVKAAGAIGAIFTSDLETFAAGITGDPDIPVFQLTNSGSDQLRPHAQAGTLNVTFDGRLAATIKRETPAQTDTISDFTSRGPRGSQPGSVVKPDVSAPGNSIGSAGVGTGNGVTSISGTSMASPVTAGIAALVKAAHPGWNPLKLKAAIMNTARHDLYTGPGKTGLRYPPARVGAGRVDAKAAVGTKLLAWTKGPNNPVTAGFGVIHAPINGGTITRTKTVKVKNLNKKTVKVSVDYESLNSQPGVSYSVRPGNLKIKAKKAKTFKITMTVVPAQLRRTIDPTMAVTQENAVFGGQEARQFVPDSSGRLLIKQKGKKPHRVPVYGAAKPTSATTTALSGSNLVVSGQGVNTGATRSDYRSLLSVLQLGATSPQVPACTGIVHEDGCALTATDRSMDLQYVGAGSTNHATDGMIYFGISTYADWPSIGNTTLPYVDISTDADAAFEYEIFLSTLAATDLLYAFTVDYETGDLLWAHPVNDNTADVDTNVFDTNVVTFGTYKDTIDLPSTGSAPITYQVGTLGPYSQIDESPVISYNAGTPTIGTTQWIWPDENGQVIPLSGSGPAQALVLHLHGAPGQRAEVINRP